MKPTPRRAGTRIYQDFCKLDIERLKWIVLGKSPSFALQEINTAPYFKDGSEILISRGKGRNPRRLTPRECARRIGLPDSFRISVSDTQAHKQFVNSVAVPVCRAVARIMTPHVLGILSRPQERRLKKSA